MERLGGGTFHAAHQNPEWNATSVLAPLLSMRARKPGLFAEHDAQVERDGHKQCNAHPQQQQTARFESPVRAQLCPVAAFFAFARWSSN